MPEWQDVNMPWVTEDSPAERECLRLVKEYREWRAAQVRSLFGEQIIGEWSLQRMTAALAGAPAGAWDALATPEQLATFLARSTSPDTRELARHRYRRVQETAWERTDATAIAKRQEMADAKLAARVGQFCYDPRCAPGVMVQLADAGGVRTLVIGGELGTTDCGIGGVAGQPLDWGAAIVLRCLDLRPMLTQLTQLTQP